ncbi:hypothetical protein F4780DRAFT_750846 [Xylariomycetidae sp. FL0641]|nr:hypothetical protein F4780DRAFT_750846 [Xylariomycetidae sp. FL0641]
MASPIKNVAVVGGSGNLGRAVVAALLDAGFSVTCLTRQGSSSTFPSGVRTVKVDYDSVASLRAALEGQDAVVSTIATAATGNQFPLVDAAVEAGVRRFVPSEWGVNSRILGSSAIGQILAGKIRTLDYAHAKARANPGFSWTGVSTGLFFDWGLDHGSIGLDKTTRTATVYDSGDEPVQCSNLAFVGRAVAGILRRPEATTNRYLTIASFNPSQNALLDIVRRETGAEWTVNRASTDEQEQVGLRKLEQGDYSAFSHLLRSRIYRDGCGLAVRGADSANALLGLEEEEDVAATLREWLRK